MRVPTKEERRYLGRRWAWVVGLALLASLVFPSSATNVAPLLEPGAVADRDVIAPFTFPVNKSDEELAREAEELAATVKPIYQFQQRAVDSAKIAMQALFTSLESAADQGGGAAAIQQAAKTQGLPLSPPEAAYLTKGGKRHGLEKALTELFERTLALGVTGPGVLQVEQAPELIVRSRSGEQAVARDQVLSYAQYLRRARAVHPDKGSSVGDELYVRLEGHFFRPTLIPDTLQTERRRDDLRRSVDPSKYIVRGGDRIVGAHEVVTSETHEKLVALHNELVRRGAATSRSAGGVLGPIVRDSLTLAIFWVLLVFYRRETYRELRQVSLVGALFGLVLLQAAAVAHFFPQHPEIVILPFLAMMLTVLLNGRVSMIAAMILSIVIGLQPVSHDVPALFLCVIGGVTAALSVRVLRRRSNFYLPVLIIALGYLAAALALGLASSWSVAEIGVRGLWGAANGLVSAGLTFFLLPVAESITGITAGLALAAEARLPDAVAAFIPEHHGTTEITYFLDRAKKSGDGGSLKATDCTYPGPKPHSSETAITMLADSVEAALRVLEDLTPKKIDEVIDHIVRTKLNAGQLDEAPMTLQQIDQVKREFVRIISGMYHNRIDYPESSGGITATWQPAAKA